MTIQPMMRSIWRTAVFDTSYGSDFSGGIIQSLDSMRIAGWNYSGGYTYADCNYARY